jgi:transcriptional regulator with XRE-family HTH domain
VHVLVRQSIGKESDDLEENEFLGEDAGPPDYGVELHDRAALAAAVFDIQRQYDVSDRRLLDEANVSHHTLAGLREGKRIADASLMKLLRATEALRQEADSVAAAMAQALKDLRRLRDKLGGRNKLAKLLGVSGPYLGRVLRGEKPMTEELIERGAQIERQT